MNIGEALANVRLLYIETAPFIYFTERRVGYVDKMRVILSYLDTRRLDVNTSTITLAESLTKPLREGDLSLVKAYNELFEETAGLSMIPVNAVVARHSAELRARYRLKTPDSLHLATAIVSDCDAFLTNDLDLKRVSEITILVLDELNIEYEGKR